MRTRNIVVALGIALSAAWVSPAAADPPPLAPAAPLKVPTPNMPKLRMPDIAPPPASLMLDSVRPLQMPQSGPRPTLNRFPGVETDPNDDNDGRAAGDDDEPRLHLQHHR